MYKTIILWAFVLLVSVGCGPERDGTGVSLTGGPNAAVSQTVDSAGNDDVQQERMQELDPGLMTGQKTVNGWAYFLYPAETGNAPSVNALFRRREDGSRMERIGAARCDHFDMIGSSVYFASYSLSGNEHGVLYLIAPDQEPAELADELCGYQIADDVIYYAYSFDTTGVGIEGHALHRMDLDGGNPMIAAYEIGSPQFRTGHLGTVRDGYVYFDDVRVELGKPADGTEKVEVLNPAAVDGEWTYYATNHLLKSRLDGSEQVILDGGGQSWISIGEITGEWIFYDDIQQNQHYKIRKDGTGKTEIRQ